jgi:hypothetical protein
MAHAYITDPDTFYVILYYIHYIILLYFVQRIIWKCLNINILEDQLNTKTIFVVKLGENELKICFQLKYCIISSRFTIFYYILYYSKHWKSE